MAFLAPIAIAASVIGTGVSVYGEYQQGQAQKAAADWNAAAMRNQAISTQYQYAQQAQEARIQAQMSEAQAGFLKAQQAQLKFQGKAIQDSASENIRRRRVEGQQAIAQQRAAYAAAGVTSSGSPLAVLSDSAGRMELDLLDMQYDAENQARDLTFQAAGLNMDIATAGYNAKASKRAASFLPKIGKYQRASLLTQADWTRRTGQSAATAGTISAAGNLLQGAGTAADKAYRYFG